MKNKLAQLVILAIAAFSIIAGDAFAGITPTVTLEAFANADAPVSETGGTMTTSTVGISVANAPSKTAVYFGAKLNTGENGTIAITSIEYTFYVNSAVGLDGLNQPIQNKPFNFYNPPGDSTLPDIRGFNSSNDVTKSSGSIANSNIASTSKMLIEQQVFALNGTARRPYMTATGHSYRIEYRIRGSFNSIPFDLTDSAQIVVLSEAPTPILVTVLKPNEVTLEWGNVVGETGFRIESSVDGGTTWQTVVSLTPDVLSQVITGLSSQTNYVFRVIAVNAGGDSAPSPELMLPKTISGATENGFVNFTVTGHGTIQYSPDLVNWFNTPPSGAIVTGAAPNRTVSLPWNPPQVGFIRVADPRNPVLVNN